MRAFLPLSLVLFAALTLAATATETVAPAGPCGLDVDCSGGPPDTATDVVYIARHLLGLPPVPASFRLIDPTIPPDSFIGDNIDAPYRATLPQSGQTAQYVQGDDGSIQAGALLSYTDNGDGTISDNTTGLTWEKKIGLNGAANAASLHDADNCYVWAGTCSGSAVLCGVDADCPHGQTCDAGSPLGCFVGATIYQWAEDLNAANFAGHNDWRIPNVKELQSIVRYGVSNPSVAAAFHGASCGTGCADITNPACSCTRSYYYWAATTYVAGPQQAWSVRFDDGYVYSYDKAFSFSVRAVRGGL